MQRFKDNELMGYRTPNQWEIERIQLCMTRELAQVRKTLIIGGVFTGIVSVGLFFSPFIINGKSIAEYAICCLLFLAFFTGFMTILKHLRWNRIQKDAIALGKFEVMDCTATSIDLNSDVTNGASVQIRNNQGQQSYRSYIIDYDSAKLAQRNPYLPLLLMRTTIGNEKQELYALFSEKMLQEGYVI